MYVWEISSSLTYGLLDFHTFPRNKSGPRCNGSRGFADEILWFGDKFHRGDIPFRELYKISHYQFTFWVRWYTELPVWWSDGFVFLDGIPHRGGVGLHEIPKNFVARNVPTDLKFPGVTFFRDWNSQVRAIENKRIPKNLSYLDIWYLLHIYIYICTYIHIYVDGFWSSKRIS